MSDEEQIRSLQRQVRDLTDELARSDLRIAELTARVQELELERIITTLDGSTAPPT